MPKPTIDQVQKKVFMHKHDAKDITGEFNTIRFNTAYTANGEPIGSIYWNKDRDTLDIRVSSDVTMQIGQEIYFHAINLTGSTILNGKAVMFAGSLGASGILKIQLAVSDGTYPATQIMGITTEDIPNGETGKVTFFGEVGGINTSTYTEGDVLYLDPTTPGGLTKTVPAAPNLKYHIATAIDSKNNGHIFVRAIYSTALSEQNDVNISSPTNGQALIYNGVTNRWENQTSSGISVSDTNSVDLTLTGSTLSADVKKQNSTTVDLSIDASGLKADLNSTLKSNYDAAYTHISNTSNPHSVTKSQVGLSNVDDLQQMPLSYLDLDKALTANSDVKVPSQKAIKFYVDNILSNANALVYKGVIDCSANPNYPAADAGHLYIVSVAGKIGGASGITVDVGDMLICNTDGTASGDQATVGAYWNIIEKNIVGAVSGPASATDGNMALFDGATGKTLKNGSPPPANTPAVSNNFITAYTSSTGAFTQARPTWADINKATSSIADITTKTHSLLSSLTADDHTQYALLAGRSGGQNLIGGTAANNALTLQANSATTGNTGTTNVFFVKTGNSGGTNAIIATNEGRVNIPVSLSIGGTPADAGELRLQNNQFITVRNAANTGNVDMIRVNSSDKVQFGTGIDLGNQSLTGAYSIEQWTSSNWKFDNVGNGYVAGNFGIGTTGASVPLHVVSANSRNIAMLHLEGTGATGGGANTDRGLLINYTKSANLGYLINVKEGGLSKFIVDTSGNVVIGTTAASGLLHIRGTGSTSATNSLYIENSLGVQIFSVNDASQVMIGSGTPAHDISFEKDGNKTIAILSTAAGIAGRVMTLAAGSTTAGTADVAGGNLQLQAGIGTGSGTSNILFRTATPGTAGTTTLQTV